MTKAKRLVIIFTVLAVLTALIIINSAVFSVRNVGANALNFNNNDDRAVHVNNLLVEHHGIRIGSSIFTLNENRAIENIRRNLIEVDGLANIEIRSLERIFPNRVMIHYVMLQPYFYVYQNGYAYVFSNNLTLINITNRVEARVLGTIRLVPYGRLTATNLGEVFETTVERDATRFSAVINAFERLIHSDLQNDFTYVDISPRDSIRTRIARSPGAVIEVRSVANFTTHFQHGFSVYRSFLASPTYGYRILSGTILVTETASGNIVTTWQA